MITTILSKSAGFYSQLFFLLNHYLYAKRNNLSFKVKSHEWLFKFKNGWDDYFKNIDIKMNNKHDLNNACFGHHQQIFECTITEYKNAIKEIYVYNDHVYEKIQKIKQQLSLKENFDAIFIRRGDKLSGESDFINTEKYIDILLSKKPNCDTIFVQTDDYNCYLDVKEYVKIKQLNINVITLCKEELKGGMIIFNCNKPGIEWAVKEHNVNKEYISTVLENLRTITPIDKLNNDQIYEHTLDMLTGIDIVLEADIVICDYSSNVSRFIKLANKDSKNVFDVNNPEKDINWNYTKCPAFELLF
jgi:uncharacterized protein YqfB (UPF0267 family)